MTTHDKQRRSTVRKPVSRDGSVRAVLTQTVPRYDRLPARLIEALEEQAQVIQVPAGRVLFDEAAPASSS